MVLTLQGRSTERSSGEAMGWNPNGIRGGNTMLWTRSRTGSNRLEKKCLRNLLRIQTSAED